MFDSIAGKVAVVTGGNSGIGRATAMCFARHGVRVAIAARRTIESLDVVQSIEKEGGEALFVQTDVSKAREVQRLIEAVICRWRQLDFAFNNAGIEGTPYVPTAEYSENVWDQVLEINLKGVFMSMKYEIPAMLQHRFGVIVNMSSLAGITGGRVGSAYYASKHGVVGITKAAAVEYAGLGIRVNAVCPGVIQTPMAERSFKDEQLKEMLPRYPMGRFGTVDEVAGAVVWLCSGAASFITGHCLQLDGGFAAR